MKINLAGPPAKERFAGLVRDLRTEERRGAAIGGLYSLAKSGAIPLAQVEPELRRVVADPSHGLAAVTALFRLSPEAWLTALHQGISAALRLPAVAREWWDIRWAAESLAQANQTELVSSIRESAAAAVRDGHESSLAAPTAVLSGFLSGGDRQSMRPLEALLADARKPFRDAAVRALGAVQTPESRAALERYRSTR